MPLREVILDSSASKLLLLIVRVLYYGLEGVFHDLKRDSFRLLSIDVDTKDGPVGAPEDHSALDVRLI